MLTDREKNLMKSAFSVGWFRALSEAEHTKVFSSTTDNVKNEFEEWLGEGARYRDKSYTIADHLSDKYT